MQNDNSQEQNPIDAQAAALLPEGASEVTFYVSSQSQLGVASLSVSHPELGTA